jgi:hypothetical protein
MTTLDDRIRSLDTSLFAAIPSQTDEGDRRSLLLLQDCVRSRGEYVYLEIGSHLGGSIQPFYIDPLCKLIYSIDKRPPFQPDERGRSYDYPENVTERMLINLSDAFPSIATGKLRTFDCDANELETSEIVEKPNFCFIDGEHTNEAVFSDFMFCLAVSHHKAIIAFHDTAIVYKGLEKIKSYLYSKSIRFEGFMLDGSVYAILLNEAIGDYSEKIEPLSTNETDYFKESRKYLFEQRLRNRYRLLYKCYRLGKKILMIFQNRSS